MTASVDLVRYWRSALRTQIASTLSHAQASVAAFAEVTAAQGSLIQSWVAGQEVLEYEHYPADDVVDVRHGSQFYYHAHRDGDQERGHLHLFWHATASGRRRYFQPGKPRWNRTEPTHLFAISLDARGLPVALFTVNQWVTDGHWLDANTTLACVDRFVMDNVEGHETSCRWLTGFVRLYRPLIKALLIQRDQRMARRSDITKALRDHRVEVLSSISIDWMADMDALQTEAARRGL
jgi:hypothetical protein